MRVLGVDTASDSTDRGYAIAAEGKLLWCGEQPPGADVAPIHVVAGERPWIGGIRAKLTGKNLVTFCVNNGFQLRDAAAAFEPLNGDRPLFVLLEVKDWKDSCLRGCAGMPGDVYCRNFRAKYAPQVQNHNVLDAIGIALAASKLTFAQLRRLSPKGFN